MENSFVNSVIQSSLESSYHSDLKNLKMVDLGLDTIMLGVGILAAVNTGSYKKSIQGRQISGDETVYQTIVKDKLSIDDKNSLFMLISNAAEYNYQIFLESFNKHFSQPGENSIYHYSFDKLAKALSNLQFKKAFVDVNTDSHRVDFYLNVGHKMLLTVSQVAKDIDDDSVLFSVEQNHETIAMDKINLHELVSKMQQIQISLG